MSSIKTFTQTSDGLYDRHNYKIVFKGGRKEIYCESWEGTQAIWFQWAAMRAIDYIEVCDIKKYKPQGF